MKKTFTVMAVLLVCSLAKAQSWQKLTVPNSTKQLEEVWFTSPVKGWAVGQTGTILTTADGGNTWVAQTHALGITHFKDVSFVNATNGWIVGANDSILTTTDGGATWTVKALPGSNDYYTVQFVTPDTGYISGTNGASGIVKRTYDGGATWQSATTGAPLYAMHFVNSRMGWACGYLGAIYATTNAGVTWTEQKPKTGSATNTMYCLFMLSAAEGWAGGNSGNMYYTADSGTTWVTKASGTNAGKTALYFFDSQRGWASTTSSLGGAKPMRSTDNGGTNWVVDSVFTSSIYGLAFSGDTLGWGVGENGVIIRMGTPPAVVNPTGIKQVTMQQNRLTAYPNPAYNILNITSEAEVEQYTVTNLLGETVLSGRPDNGFQFQLNTSQIPRGTYLVCTHAGGKQHFMRFIKN